MTNPMLINIRRAVSADVPWLAEKMREFYKESAYSLDCEWALRSFTRLLSHPELGGILIAANDREAIGYVVFTQRFSMEFGGLDGFIDDLFVVLSHRRAGVGTALIEAVVAECNARRLLALHVEVDPNNQAANALYRRFGLHDKGRRLLTVSIGSNARPPHEDKNESP